ncbi:hypothetical protein M427DRAFT_429592 [Gonapodya prolifera JEL478]|uniref:PCI domain-containing protein n=1 Tax=Gonapodya prolifera (strain JEL478) TaxID=1344416 RepID=A0A139ASQ4_GONPJ|nr:hypothetical protein M427DRAFT_429592 [Gonapodya prolifera JEL478]|eukprot:KXS19771.1 hypothetical protein M427DRAFT_429592 [Gonapodya prolifera JEL478]
MSEAILNASSGARLEPFVLLAKTAKGAACAKLVLDAVAAPGVFVFSELLDSPNVKELATNSQFAGHHQLLEIFAYGTFPDYQNRAGSLPQLTQAQLKKLQQLTLVSLAGESSTLPYSNLLHALSLPSVRDLEDLIIDAMYQDLLKGKLDQARSALEVEQTMGRDLVPGREEKLLGVLGAWASTAMHLLHQLDQQIERTSQAAADNRLKREQHEKEIERARKDVMDSGKASGH